MYQSIRRIFSITARAKSTWSQPEGYDTGIKVYNCVVREKVPLIVSKSKPYMTWYTCGPTVYDSAHIGHASCYVKLDIIQRILRDYFKLRLITVMNITDIDDKIINESKLANRSPIEIARYYEREYLEDLDLLKVRKPDVVLRVTDNMKIIVNFIKKLIDCKQAYIAKDNSVYFDVQAYGNYGKLHNIGENTDTSDFKRSPMDFALWKAAKPGEPFWDSVFGPGRPGWHIECSALAGNVLGSTIDVHAGGIDLRFPHHENEEAQSCSYFSTEQWVNYWIHTGHLHLKGTEKMSKSLKNTISIRDMLKNTTSDAFRMACLMSHYRNNMEFSEDLIKTAEKNLSTVKNFIENCNIFLKGHIQVTLDNELLLSTLDDTIFAVKNALQDDFNTPLMLKAVNRLISTTNKMLGVKSMDGVNVLNHSVCIVAISNYVNELFRSFGVDVFAEDLTRDSEYNEIVDLLIKFRHKIRQVGLSEKNESMLQVCDEIRDELRRVGVYVKDHGKISSWSR